MTAADHKVNAVRQARSDAVRLLRPMYVFMWDGPLVIVG